jgi:acylphosphatase
MGENLLRAEILAEGMVQGVGFRYFVYRNALRLGLKGYTENLYSGDKVLTVVEGERFRIEELYEIIKTGPAHASVKRCTVKWSEYKGEFREFGIKS